ncbi:MAG: twin-arginine translocase TatA/TatE family subunit [Hyphomicrobiaceae bacterium]
MGATSIWHWIIVLLIVVLLFGRGKISEIMTDVAKGIKSFKKGMSDDEQAAQKKDEPKAIDNAPPAGTTTASSTSETAGKTG